MALVAGDMEAVNALIGERMRSGVPMIPDLAGHLINSGGKRLRPMLTLAAARLSGYSGQDHVKLAATVEFIHTATLLHDDVVDGSDMRRGKAAANILWGNKPSVLVGDFLFSRAFQLMVETGSLRVLDILSNASAVIAEGEVMQLTTTNNIATTEDIYMQVIAAKTAALFAAATEVGAVVAGLPEEKAAALATYGRSFGIAFQLIDDVLDYGGTSEALGKSVGDDFREGKVTLPMLLAHARGTAEEKAFWTRVVTPAQQRDGDLARAIGLMQGHGALADTVKTARAHGETAKRALDGFPDVAERQVLLDIVDFCVERAY
ncbi:MAG: polyprenyl synthetase family protein [Alphaproteobacteria bacterium]|nr:polyprenyl synthetase family protein [Alphaproteobacteria bacterium]MDX5368818.1 polyprenyl synthetase family protein [Alphaproteobacteria bacterium]MDX5463546.1 polyprenyl synthetase family protein [Alphaproteobacteria bacterium]